jgi:NADPH:quinone reductase-like Zn-dependent oxidoreductase
VGLVSSFVRRSTESCNYSGKVSKPYREDLMKLFQLLSEGKIKPVVARVLPFSETETSHEMLE